MEFIAFLINTRFLPSIIVFSLCQSSLDLHRPACRVGTRFDGQGSTQGHDLHIFFDVMSILGMSQWTYLLKLEGFNRRISPVLNYGIGVQSWIALTRWLSQMCFFRQLFRTKSMTEHAWKNFESFKFRNCTVFEIQYEFYHSLEFLVWNTRNPLD